MEQLSQDQTITGEIIGEPTETVIKQEIHEDLAGFVHEIEALEEAVEFYPTFTIPENGCLSENKARVEQSEYDGSHELDSSTQENKCMKSHVQCKEENNIKYDDLQTDSPAYFSVEAYSGCKKDICKMSCDGCCPSLSRSTEQKSFSEIVIKQEIHEDLAGLAHEIITLKEEEAVRFYPTGQYLNSASVSESEYEARVKQNGSDGSHELDICTLQNECRKSPVQCKEEAIDVIYEDIQTESGIQPSDCKQSCTNDGRERRKKIKLQEGSEAKSGVDLYKCQECSYAAKQAWLLKTHMLVHKPKSEVDLYRCQECSYAAKRPGCLKRHILIHKPKSEVDLYKCQECSYTAKRADYLKGHMLAHRAKPEANLHKCPECSYAAKKASHLKGHILIHRPKSEVALYKCQECSYAARRPGNLKKHTLTHRAISEVALYKCLECSYATKQAGDIKRHMLIHRPKSEVALYKCQECSYAAIRPGNLKKHTLTHRAKSEVALYKCLECSYATKQAGDIKTHMLIHRPKSEVDLYKCQKFSYAAK